MSVIGKSNMASIKLKGFFAPNMAALINKRDNKYFIAASETKIKVKINGQEIAGQKELNEGDLSVIFSQFGEITDIRLVSLSAARLRIRRIPRIRFSQLRRSAIH